MTNTPDNQISEETPLHCEPEIILTVQAEGIENVMTSVFVGQYKLDHFIITTPKELQQVEVDQLPITINYSYGGKKWYFTTVTSVRIDDPAPILFLKYPDKINYHNMRRVKRTAIMVPCIIDTVNHEEYYGTLLDLSPIGALCQVALDSNPSLALLQTVKTIRIKCVLPGIKDEIFLIGAVRNYYFDEKGNIKLGIEFIEVEPETSDVITKFLA